MPKKAEPIQSELLGKSSFFGAEVPFSEVLNKISDSNSSGYTEEAQEVFPNASCEELANYASLIALQEAIFNWKAYATIRLLAYDDNLSCFCALVVAERSSWTNELASDEEYTRVWPVLTAIAVNDLNSLSRMRKKSMKEVSVGHPRTVSLYNAVVPLKRKSGANSVASSKRDWISTLTSLASEENVDSAIRLVNSHLELYRKRKDFSSVDNILPVELLGILKNSDTLSEIVTALNDEPFQRLAKSISGFEIKDYHSQIGRSGIEFLKSETLY